MQATGHTFIGEVRIDATLLAHMENFYPKTPRSYSVDPFASLTAEAQSLTIGHSAASSLPDFALNRTGPNAAKIFESTTEPDCIRLTFRAAKDELLLTFDLKDKPHTVIGDMTLPFRKINSALQNFRAVRGDNLIGEDGRIPRFDASEPFRRYSHIEAMRSLFPGPVNREEASFGANERGITTIIAMLCPKGPFNESMERASKSPAPVHPSLRYQDGFAVFDKHCTPA